MYRQLAFQPAFVLSRRPYKETSALIRFFCQEAGIICVLAKGARNNKKGRASLLAPFSPLLIEAGGRGELLTLYQVEANGKPYRLGKTALLCGLYINELIVKLLHEGSPLPELFPHYETILAQLTQTDFSEAHLRIFEKNLLVTLGYELPLTHTFDTKELIRADLFYQFIINAGFKQIHHPTGLSLKGDSIIALAEESFTTAYQLTQVKHLMRYALNFYLEGKPLHSRQLFS